MPELNKRLAEAVEWWIDRHSLTQPVISSRGGPSSTTLTKITKAEGNIRAGVIHDLDAGLGWGEGTASAYLAGEDPLGIHQAAGTPEEWTDEQLLAELGRRLLRTQEGGQHHERQLTAEKRAWPDDGGPGRRRRRMAPPATQVAPEPVSDLTHGHE